MGARLADDSDELAGSIMKKFRSEFKQFKACIENSKKPWPYAGLLGRSHLWSMAQNQFIFPYWSTLPKRRTISRTRMTLTLNSTCWGFAIQPPAKKAPCMLLLVLRTRACSQEWWRWRGHVPTKCGGCGQPVAPVHKRDLCQLNMYPSCGLTRREEEYG